MQLHAPFVRLPRVFDAERLAGEVDALPVDAWRRHPTGHVGNTAVSLVSRNGDHTDDSVGGPQATTTWLAPDSYLAQVIASFGVPVGRTRLMRIDPQGEAIAHFDVHLYWFDRVRIHVPIITTESVEFLCGEDRVHMAAGESWVFDTFRMHNVLNPNPTSRVHLVIDTVGTPAVWDMIRCGPTTAADSAIGPVTSLVYEPARVPLILTEQVNISPVIQPWQLESIAARLVQHFPDTSAANAIRSESQSFVEGWRALWALHGPQPGAVGYATERDRFVAALQALPDDRLTYNGASIISTTRTLLAGSALGPDLPAAAPAPAPNLPADVALPAAQAAAERDRRFDRPVIVVSPPRAGSTLLFETLSQSPDVFTIGRESHMLIESIPSLTPSNRGWDSNELDASDATGLVVERLRQSFFDDLRDRRGTPPPMNAHSLRVVEKVPKNALRIEFLDRVFPDARYIYLSREHRDEISSMIDAWRSGKFVTYPDLPGWTGLPWSMLLIPGWRELIGTDLEVVCARQWEYTTNRILDDLDRLAPGRWTVANYRSLVDHPQQEMTRLCQFAGLRWDQRIEGALPLARHTLTPPSPDKWHKNRAEIERVLPSVAETARRAARVAEVGPTREAPRRKLGVVTPAVPTPGDNALSSVHTDSVRELLRKASSSILMSTYQSGKLITMRTMVDAATGSESLNTHFTAMPKPMGIAVRQDGRLTVGTRDEVWTYRNQPQVARKIEPPGSYSAAFVLRGRHHTGDIAIHEMAYASDDELWLVNTRFSCLSTLDDEHSFVPRWQPPFVTGMQPDDRCHLNGLAMRDGRPKYVSLFADSDRPNGWRDVKAFGGAVMDIDTDEFVARGLCMPHTPRWYRDQLWVLESGRGSLSRIDLHTGASEVVVTLPGFTRGMTFIGRYALIGLSQVRESVFDDLPLTRGDTPIHSGLWVVDLETGLIAGFIRFDGAVQEIFDVQLIRADGHIHIVDLDAEAHSLSFVVPTVDA